MAGKTACAGERRAKIRYPVEMNLLCRTLGDGESIPVTGRTVNLSSRGVLIETSGEHHLAAGRKVEIKMQWPCLLEGGIPVNLVATGTVVRCGASRFAATMDCHEFRIMAMGRRLPGWNRGPGRQARGRLARAGGMHVSRR